MSEEKIEKRKKINKVILIVFFAILALFIIIAIACSSTEITADGEYSLKYGEFISATTSTVIDENDVNRIVIKAKIDSKITSYNYENVIDLIKNQGLDEYEEVQYWAVMEFDDDESYKVISFTVESDLIDKVVNDKVDKYDIENYLTDLWISSVMYQ